MINRAQCRKCGDIIESKSVHDFQTCKCGAISVDGGRYYCRRAAMNPDDIIELSDEGRALSTLTLQELVLIDVLCERKAQDAEWGEQNHDPEVWLAILMEEVGELAQAILHRWVDKPYENLRTEAVQVAAVALAIIECCDRNKWMPT